MNKHQTRSLATMALVILWIVGCAPSQQAAPSGPAGSPATPAPAAKKILTVVEQVEPAAFVPNLRPGLQTAGLSDVQYIVHDALAVQTSGGVYAPQLVTELPSLDDGTWRLNADGTMDTVWHLRPNIKWQDGQPLTSADLMFTFLVNKDPDIPHSEANSTARLRESATAPDDLTFDMHWTSRYVTADHIPPGDILPQHLLGDLYNSDKNAFLASPFFTTEFVGLGPYRLVNWVQGAYIETGRFDDYYQGRPPLDEVVVRFAQDPNTQVANVLSGAADIAVPGSSTGIDLDTAYDVQQRWVGTGNQVLTSITGRVYVLEPQYRPEDAKPTGAATVRAVRQALYQAIDRQSLSDAMTHGLSPTADSDTAPNDPVRPQLQIPPYPFDPARAAQLFADAGWTPGPDGVLVNSATGERFDAEQIWAREGGGNDKMAAVVADNWKAVGAAAGIYVEPTALRGSGELEATRPGFLIINPSANNVTDIDRLSTHNIPSAATQWAGNNYGGYANPQVDTLVDQLHVSIDPRERLPLLQQLMTTVMGDVAWLPLYWQVVPTLELKGVQGPRPDAYAATSNIFEWDKS